MAIDYAARERSFELYRKGKVEGTWDPDDFDFTQDAEDWQSFTEDERRIFLATASGFYEGEEDVTRTLAPYMTALDALEGATLPFDPVQEEIYLSQQMYEEAKHTDFFSRYYEEVIGTQDTAQFLMREGDSYETADLYDQAADLLEAVRVGDQQQLIETLGMAFLNYHGVLEAQRARAGYMVFDQMCQSKAADMDRDPSEVLPGFQAALGKVRQDETRHIENGRWMLKQLADTDPDIVERIYEPRIAQYVEANVLTDGIFEEMPFSHFDEAAIGRKSLQHLQDTVDYIGAEQFDRFADVRATIESMRTEAAAADDD